MNKAILNRLMGWMTIILTLVVVGTAGFVLLEGWSVHDGFYMTVITLSTVGYGEVKELTSVGQIYCSLLIIFSMLLVTCWTAGITSMIISGDFKRSFQQSKARRILKKMNDHTVVCGAGRLMEASIRRLVETGNQVVLITNDEELANKIRKDFPVVAIINGDPLNDPTLQKAKLHRARNLVSVLECDYDNLLVAMAARDINPEIVVFARADAPHVTLRMRRCGVDSIISPAELGAISITDRINIGYLDSSATSTSELESPAIEPGSLNSTRIDENSLTDDLKEAVDTLTGIHDIRRLTRVSNELN